MVQNRWLQHVEKFRRNNKDLKPTDKAKAKTKAKTNPEENENNYWTEAYTCTGHDVDDAALPASLPWLDGFEELADTDGDGIITNWEYYLAINPNNEDGLDYIFGDFEWSHCQDKI